jgi:TatA/E family protein of Tat protein translocase
MLGFQEVILILAILLLVFGPTKLPELARALGKAVREFNRASRSLAEAIETPIEKEVSKIEGKPSAVRKQTSATPTKGKPIKQGSEVTNEE